MSARPGPWLRLTAVAGAVGVAAVVATGSWGLAHDVAAHVTLALLAATVLTARLAHPDRPELLWTAAASFLLFAAAGVAALADAPTWLHVAFGAAALVAAALCVAVSLRGGRPVPRASWRDYVTLTKPRIMVLLLITAAGGLVVGTGGWPSAGLALATLGGLALACGGASALNHVLDRDIDTHMKRTASRPVASGRVPPERALEFGLALSALSYVVLASFVNVLAAVLALVGNLFYVIVYTRWLKRTTPQNIVIGGAAGRRPAARRLRGRDRRPHAHRPPALPHRVLLDAAALLGARAPDQARLRGRRDSRCSPSCAASARRRAPSSSTPSCWSA